MPIGLMPDAAYTSSETALGPGDTLIMYTDGITEAENSEGDDYGEDRLAEMLVANKNLGAVAIIDAVLEHLSEFTNSAPFEDDVTMLVARRTGGSSS